ncbi:MAG TPA: nucleotide exchange factor GrpE [Candidatus Dormibacteraeota bacterium]|jgi:molecular chaperone GrpE|nr:nucleotide exchange factor GrpE [Candidatus Dormibacteraeota bacterium]
MSNHDPNTPPTEKSESDPTVEESKEEEAINRIAEGKDARSAEEKAGEDGRTQELVSQLEAARDAHLRLAADFENFKKRSRQERTELLQYGTGQLIERLLPVLDDAERVLEHVPEGVDENWLKGVRMTVAKLLEALEQAGLEPVEAVGIRFDPKLHEAIATEVSEDHEEDTVLDEVRRGYRLHDRVLRPALVRVSRLPAAKQEG